MISPLEGGTTVQGTGCNTTWTLHCRSPPWEPLDLAASTILEPWERWFAVVVMFVGFMGSGLFIGQMSVHLMSQDHFGKKAKEQKPFNTSVFGCNLMG